MIKIVSLGGLSCPCAFCDYCGERIEKDGLLVWKAVDRNDVKMIHKGECDRANNSQYGQFKKSVELTKAVNDLLHNISAGLVS